MLTLLTTGIAQRPGAALVLPSVPTTLTSLTRRDSASQGVSTAKDADSGCEGGGIPRDSACYYEAPLTFWAWISTQHYTHASFRSCWQFSVPASPRPRKEKVEKWQKSVRSHGIGKRNVVDAVHLRSPPSAAKTRSQCFGEIPVSTRVTVACFYIFCRLNWYCRDSFCLITFIKCFVGVVSF